MDKDTETMIKRVADEIGANFEGPYRVQEGVDTGEQGTIGTFDNAFDAIVLAYTTAAQSTKHCFVLDPAGRVPVVWPGRK